jgi:RNA ligase (TIGR02306 family)
MRKLASIQKVIAVEPIDGADNIEKVRINGWWVVVQKAENYSVGERVVYFEIDTFLPEKGENTPWQYLIDKRPKTYNGVVGHVLRTVKLRGVFSQGFVMKLSTTGLSDDLGVGDDVTEILGVSKYEPPVPAQIAGMAKGLFPSFIKKTDQERIQNLIGDSSFADDYDGWQYQVTEKLDGTSATFAIREGEIFVCSRNLSLKETEDNVHWMIFNRDNLKDVLIDLSETYGDIALQGEILGGKIQGNVFKINPPQFFLFDMFLINEGCYAPPHVIHYINETYGVKTVPILDHEVTLTLSKDNLDEFILSADGVSTLGNSPREGLVYKRIDGRKSFKVISNKWLGKQKED